jgi:hypothetical protein
MRGADGGRDALIETYNVFAKLLSVIRNGVADHFICNVHHGTIL